MSKTAEKNTKSKTVKNLKNNGFTPRNVAKGDHVVLVDGSGYIFRAYHALPPLTRKSDGAPVGAVHGFCQMLWKLIQDHNDGEPPSHIAVIFDAARENFRNEIYPEYKANRPPAPEDLIPQFPQIRRAVDAFHVCCIEQEGYEADDLIATYAVEAVAAGGEVTIVSSDKDLMQLIRPGISMLDTMKNNRRINAPEVMDKFGVAPEKVIDVQSLAGDSTDNVPGVPGIGIKTAALLIDEYGDLDTLLTRAEEIKQKKRRENLIEFAEQARISRDLVTLKQDVPVDVSLDQMVLRRAEADVVLDFLNEMEFTKLTERIANALGADVPPPKAAAKSSNAGGMLDLVGGANPKRDGAGAGGSAKGAAGGTGGTGGVGSVGPDQLAALRAGEQAAIPIDVSAYETVTTMADLQRWIEDARALGHVSFDTETTSLDAMQAELVGVSLATQPGKACYVPLGHRASEGLDLDGAGELQQIPLQEAVDALKPLLEDRSVLKIGQNLKYDALLLKRYNITLAPFDDTMLLSYDLDAGLGGHGMDELALRHLDHKCISFKDIAGSGRKKLSFDQVPLDQATQYAGEDADVTLRLWHILKPRLVAERMTTLYQTIDLPMAMTLVDMEAEGVKVDRTILARLSKQFAETMEQLQSDIHAEAGEDFNVASPKQLGEILFDKMNLPGGKKTKTGAWSTGADVLEDLANSEDLTEKDRKLPGLVLQWRGLAKLKSTYTDALPEFINPDTGRIHTSYAMAATSTGRLASTDPNLQNIPIRTAEGREIRTAFIAEKGNKLISADYSQIELRVLAHIADIENLKQAFADGLDIHAMTASEMFGVPIKDMDPMIRRRAKAINFGIIYGISAFGLANQLAIARSEASDYIKTYFERFPGIRAYMDETKIQAHEEGFVETIFGRKIHYPQINTGNAQHRAFYERAAINAPIQGSAADIIRRAMIRMPSALKQAKLKARMLLQVHDELIFEAPEKEVDKTLKTVCKIMENACAPVLELSVPLKVDAAAADNWDEAH